MYLCYMKIPQSCLCQPLKRAWSLWGLVSILCLSPSLADDTSSDAYALEDHAELAHLPVRVKGIIDKYKKEFSHISHFFHYNQPGVLFFIGFVALGLGFFAFLFCMSLLGFLILLYLGEPFRDRLTPMIFWTGVCALSSAWALKKFYASYVNPGCIFLTDKGVLFVDHGANRGEWIPYGDIKSLDVSINGTKLILEVVKDFDFCYVKGLVSPWKSKTVEIEAKDIGGEFVLAEFCKLLIEKLQASRVDLILKKSVYHRANAKAQLLAEKEAGNSEAGAEEDVMTPASLASKMDAILAEEAEEGDAPLFGHIAHYAPYKTSWFDYFLLPLMCLASCAGVVLRGIYNASYTENAWITGIVLGILTIFFAINSRDAYVKNKYPGGWFLTDTGVLLIEPGEELKYTFFPYDAIICFLFDGCGKKEISIVSKILPSWDINASDMASEEVFDDFVEAFERKLAARDLEAEAAEGKSEA